MQKVTHTDTQIRHQKHLLLINQCLTQSIQYWPLVPLLLFSTVRLLKPFTSHNSGSKKIPSSLGETTAQWRTLASVMVQASMAVAGCNGCSELNAGYIYTP